MQAKIYRVKKGRIRICYIGRSDQKRIIVLYISDTPRKEGDVNDPYAVLSRMLRSGDYDTFFDDLGIPFPKNLAAAANEDVTSKLNEVFADESSGLDPALRAAQSRSVSSSKW